jgi:CheY-like chemotaxis protein
MPLPESKHTYDCTSLFGALYLPTADNESTGQKAEKTVWKNLIHTWKYRPQAGTAFISYQLFKKGTGIVRLPMRFRMSKKSPIVIVEDDQDDQHILREVFRELGAKNELLIFDDSQEVYHHLMSVEEKPFLIICDINLPGMDGIELKQKIDTTDFLRRKAIPFVFLTTSDEQQTVDDAYRNTNLQGYFKKGHSMQEMRNRLKCILEYWGEAQHPYGK